MLPSYSMGFERFQSTAIGSRLLVAGRRHSFCRACHRLPLLVSARGLHACAMHGVGIGAHLVQIRIWCSWVGWTAYALWCNWTRVLELRTHSADHYKSTSPCRNMIEESPSTENEQDRRSARGFLIGRSALIRPKSDRPYSTSHRVVIKVAGHTTLATGRVLQTVSHVYLTATMLSRCPGFPRRECFCMATQCFNGFTNRTAHEQPK